MISTDYDPYPVNDKSSSRHAPSQPHIYSPPESLFLPRSAMYPHLHTSGCPSPIYIYSAYEKHYSKDGWITPLPGSWSTFYPFSPRSSSLPETAVNSKVTVFPPQPLLTSDIDTPSSISSHHVLTPSSPFMQHDATEAEFQAMDFDEFDGDDEEDFIDSDFGDEMEGIDETEQGPSPLYGASEPHVVKSTSALEGALGDSPSSSYGTDLGAFTPADRRLSASVPGYPSTSHRSTAAAHHRWTEKVHSPAAAPTSSVTSDVSHPSQHSYTQDNYGSSISLFAPASLVVYNPVSSSSSSSLAGAFASSVPSPHASRSTSHPLPILQPQPIRPIPPIPLVDLAASANESTRQPRTLSPLPLLCQPVSDAVRYQLKEPPANGTLDDTCYDEENASESMCEDLITAPENDQFAQQRLTFCQEHPSCAVEGKLYSRGCMNLPIRWQ